MNNIKILLLTLLSSTYTAAAFGTTITVGPSDCSAPTVNAAISGASAGDTINLTCTGAITWSTQVNLSGGKTLKGPGIFNSSDGTNHGTWPLVINSTVSGSPTIVVTCAASQKVNRVTGFKFSGSGMTRVISISGAGTGTDGNGAFRVDNNFFNNPTYSDRMFVSDGSNGQLNGLFDHNYFLSGHECGLGSSYQSWKGSSSTCYGYDSLYNRPITWGSADFVFFEDNQFNNVGIDSGGEGTRYVVRYNTFTSDSTSWDMNPIDGHGADTRGHHCTGFVAGEVYNNTTIGSKAYAQFVHARSGRWLIYNNSVASGSIQLNEQRVGTSCSTQLDWNTCSGGPCCTAAYKQCPTASDFLNAYPLPNQINNTFIWNNNSGDLQPTVLNDGAVQTYIAAGRDFFTTAYSYTPFAYPHPLTTTTSSLNFPVPHIISYSISNIN